MLDQLLDITICHHPIMLCEDPESGCDDREKCKIKAQIKCYFSLANKIPKMELRWLYTLLPLAKGIREERSQT